MTPRRIDAAEPTAPAGSASGGDLVAGLETPLPAIDSGTATAIFLYGSCFHRRRRVEGVTLIVDGVRHRPQAARMPRLDVFRSLHPELGDGATAGRDPASDGDPEVRCYRSGFWATVPISAPEASGAIEVIVEARLAGGGSATAELGCIEVVDRSEPRPPTPPTPRSTEGAIAICMATYNPDVELLHVQLDSIRAQTDGDWICLISDDCSTQERFAAIEAATADDPRFVVSRSEARLGFYRNFERALRMAPAEIELVALADQDDRWHPTKLAILRAALGDAKLVYSDMRLVDPGGAVLRESLWEGRRNNHTNLASLLIANSVAGAASLLRREVVDLAVPFPEGPGWQFHDHWIGLVALASGRVAYVDRPLYDYVQHSNAILGQVAIDREARGGRRLASPRGLFARWRAAYFRAYVQARLQAEVLLVRCAPTLVPRKRRVLRRFAASERSLLAFAWLALRPLRRLIGRDETLGVEALFVRGLLWRRLIEIRARSRETPGNLAADASLPPFDLDRLEQRRMRRWRAGLGAAAPRRSASAGQ